MKSRTKLIISKVLVVLYCAYFIAIANSHPQCTDFYPPFEDVDVQYCSQYREFGCCIAERDAQLEELSQTVLSNFPDDVIEECQGFLEDILCQECSPYAAHQFNMEGRSKADWSDFPGLCTQYCLDFHGKCSQLVPNITNNKALLDASSVSSQAFCEAQQIDDVDYCFPSVLYDENFNNEVREGQIGSGDDCLCLEEFANNLQNPLALSHADDSTHRLYVIEQSGVVNVFFRNGSYLEDPYLDIQDLVYVSGRRGDERGLLGLAFHPNYAENRKFYVHYTTRQEGVLHVRISELMSFSNDTNRADPQTERILIQTEEPAGNHNGGSIFFAPDGYLYISLGDGGNAGDPFGEYGNGLNLTTFLGKILRIDVDGSDGWLPYTIPPDNPFVHEDPYMYFHEIFAYGVRNMWRCSVDRGNPETGEGAGRIFCGDVGQNKYEEIDIIVNGGNYGWRAKEGFSCYDKDLCNDEFLGDNYVDPIYVYHHSEGKSVTGGYVYRGCMYPHLQGLYIYGDFWNGRLFKLQETDDGEWENKEICLGTNQACTGQLWNHFPKNILSFGEDELGELYMMVTDLASSTHSGGKIFKFVDPNKRGNPEECHKEAIPVPVFGPISPFQPSSEDNERTTKGENIWEEGSSTTSTSQKSSDCPEQCQAHHIEVTKASFCKSKYAFFAKVTEITNYNSGVTVSISDVSLLRKKSYIREPDETDELTLNRGAYLCGCPDLEEGETYFFMGSYRFNSRGDFVIKSSSVVQQYHWYLALQYNQWLNSKRCR